tara:strand:- start:1247 stop:1993 length:747 start_codon:yes stop_codon:yes gene_type:complete
VSFKSFKEFYQTEAVNRPELSSREIAQTMKSLEKQIIGKKIPISKFKRLLQDKFDNIPIEVTHIRDPKISPGEMNINAFYNSDADEDPDFDEFPIEIQLIIGKGIKHIIIDNTELWTVFSKRFEDALLHELVHRAQAFQRHFKDTAWVKDSYLNKRNPKQKESQIYLADSDEIEAYSRDIASELMRSQKTKKRAITALKSIRKNSLKKSLSMFVYLTAFNFDMGHPVIRKVIKKVLWFLDIMEKEQTK